MGRSDSSDSERGSRNHKSKRRSRRSRSNSSSSDERKRRSKSDRKRSRSRERKRSRSRERKRSRSRERRRSRSRSREKRTNRSRSRERKRSRSRERGKRSRSRSTDRHSRNHSRRSSRSRSKERYRKTENTKSPIRSFSSAAQDEPTTSQKKPTWDARPADLNLNGRYDESLSLKDKIKIITGETISKDNIVIPTADEISRIENENFIQEKFSSTYIDPSNQPKQKKKKKNKNKNNQQKIQTSLLENKKDEVIKDEKMEIVSHENAIFGATEDTLHVSRFSSRIDGKRKDELKTVGKSDDLIFGAMFYDDPEVRMKRWVKKLKTLREKILAEQ